MELPFDSVSVHDVKSIHQRQSGSSAAHRGKNWSALRRANGSEQVKITKEVIAWLSQLPPDTRPRGLATQYPRIFNKVAELWAHPLSCEKYLDELLLDDRGSRQGFPVDVAGELTSLKTHLIETKNIRHVGVCGEPVGSE